MERIVSLFMNTMVFLFINQCLSQKLLIRKEIHSKKLIKKGFVIETDGNFTEI